MSRRGRTHHGDVVRQDAWMREHGETLRRAHDVLPDRDRRRLGRVLDALKMGHIVAQDELNWALGVATEALQ